MSDNPDNTQSPSGSGKGRSEGGWYVPPNAASIPESPADSGAATPLPTNASPERTGGWYAPGSNTGATPSGAMPPVSQPEPTEAPAPAAEPVPGANLPGSARSDEINYDQYVPGVGVVAEGAASQPPTAQTSTDAASAAAPVAPALVPVPAEATPTSQPTPVIPMTINEPPPAATPRVTVAPPPADAPLTQKFDDVEQQVHVLRRRYTAGLMSPDQLRGELRQLMILDNSGQWWMIGMETDRWYRYDGRDWILDTPPGRAPAAGTPVAAKPTPTYQPTVGLPATPGTPTMPLASGASVTMTNPQAKPSSI